MSTQTVDYSTLTDAELNFEILKRLGRNDFGDAEHVEHYMDCGQFRENWAQDANAALTLFDATPCFELHGVIVMWCAWYKDEEKGIRIQQCANTPARAICECWLAWQDAKR